MFIIKEEDGSPAETKQNLREALDRFDSVTDVILATYPQGPGSYGPDQKKQIMALFAVILEKKEAWMANLPIADPGDIYSVPVTRVFITPEDRLLAIRVRAVEKRIKFLTNPNMRSTSGGPGW